MADSGNENMTKAVEVKLITANPARSRLRLGSIREVRRELQKVYGDAKAGRISTQDGSRLVFMLQSLAGMIRDSDLEERIKKLEQRHDKKS
jgi:hypothetical protein